MRPRLLTFLLVISGEQGSLTHGSVVDGRFEGFIKTFQGTYYVEPAERYIKDKNSSFHSVIYHEDDVSKSLRLLSLLEKSEGRCELSPLLARKSFLNLKLFSRPRLHTRSVSFSRACASPHQNISVHQGDARRTGGVFLRSFPEA